MSDDKCPTRTPAQEAHDHAMHILHEAEAERERCAISEARTGQCPDCEDLRRQLAEARAERKEADATAEDAYRRMRELEADRNMDRARPAGGW